jgi:hypothetical protein
MIETDTKRPAPSRPPGATGRVRLPGFSAEEDVGLGDWSRASVTLRGQTLRQLRAASDRAEPLDCLHPIMSGIQTAGKVTA